jgi:TRAP-type mannitol/chloroaromatic compound transport system substrate-binding protein
MQRNGPADLVRPASSRPSMSRGAKLTPFPQDVLEAGFAAANEVYDRLAAENADFKTIYDSMTAFRSEGYLWFQVGEYPYDAFMIRNRSKG